MSNEIKKGLVEGSTAQCIAAGIALGLFDSSDRDKCPKCGRTATLTSYDGYNETFRCACGAKFTVGP